MIASLRVFWNNIGRRKSFWIPILFFSISTYGFSVFNRTIGIDDLASELYIGSGHVMIAAGRWGMVLWNKLAAIPRVSPASDRLLATSFLLLAGIMLSALFFDIHQTSQNRQFVYKYTVLSCFLITYPILGEIWEYSGANYMSTGGMLISIVSCYYLQTRQTIGIKELLATGLLMTLPMSSYESGVLFYITLVCAILFYKYCVWSDRGKSNLYWKNACIYAIPLVIAFFLRMIIGYLLRLLLGVAKGHNGATGIRWGTDPFIDVFRKLIIDTVLNYIVNGLVYLPIAIFLLAELFLIFFSVYLTIKKRNGIILLGGLFLTVSVFALPILQGTFMQYRTAITLSILTSFAFFLLVESVERNGTNLIKMIVSGGVLYLIWTQSAYLNSELALNNQRSENEMRTMSIIAQKIVEMNTEKPVIFIGEYDMGEYFRQAKKGYAGSAAGYLYQKVIDAFINRFGDYYYTFFHLTEFPDSNVNSMINYAIAVNGMMENYLAYLGYDIDVINRVSAPEAVDYAEEIVEQNHMSSYALLETDDFVIATLSVE